MLLFKGKEITSDQLFALIESGKITTDDVKKVKVAGVKPKAKRAKLSMTTRRVINQVEQKNMFDFYSHMSLKDLENSTLQVEIIHNGGLVRKHLDEPSIIHAYNIPVAFALESDETILSYLRKLPAEEKKLCRNVVPQGSRLATSLCS